ncbi:MAG: helix-hairpin-helix domain-containing protein, partial [Paraprevotella sp.]|nr:helix-hairpin-helix domain-containing protein [Paraprevotella sp.]
LLYTYSFMTMYGQGMRAACVAEWNISKHFMLMLKYGITAYTDRTEIGEGLQRIGSRYKNDLSFLLKCKF